MSQRSTPLVVFFLLVSLHPFLVAQKVSDKPAENTPTLRVRTELVVVPVVVTDKAGNHLAGLKQEEFSLQENDNAQKIAYFEEVTSDAKAFAPKHVEKNSFTNIRSSQAARQRVTILLFDLLNTQFQDQKRMREAVVKFLSESLDASEPTALYVLTRNGLKVIHDFTTDPRVLIAAVKRVKGSTEQIGDAGTALGDVDPADALSVSVEAQALGDALDESAENLASFERRVAIQITLEAMQELAKAFAGLPGRKSLIWATGSFPFSVSDNSMSLAPIGRETLTDVIPLYERAWEAVNDANLAIYPVDVRGLVSLQQFDAGSRTAPIPVPGVGRSRNQRPSIDWSRTDSLDTLKAFAEASGGKAFYNDNDIAKGFREAAKDSSAYYLLTYHLDRKNKKAGWRKLQVRSDHPGARVRARSGFFLTDAALNGKVPEDMEMVEALTSPLDYTELPLTLTWVKSAAVMGVGRQVVEYEVQFPPNAATVDEADHNHILVEYSAMVKVADGRPAAKPERHTFEAHLTPEVLSQVRKKGLRFRDSLELPNGDYTIRFVVRDELSGNVGSVQGTLRFEPLAPDIPR